MEEELKTLQFYQGLVIDNINSFEEKFKEIVSNPEKTSEFNLNGYRIRITLARKYHIQFYNENGEYIYSLLFSTQTRKMNFKKKHDDLNWEYIFGADDIEKYIDKYQIDHPTFYDQTKKKNITFSSRDYAIIFNDINITEIFDDEFQEQISINEFNSLKCKNCLISNLYINIPDDNISKEINNDKILFNDKRQSLRKEASLFFEDKKKMFFWLSGGKKIGKTAFIKYLLFGSNNFYFNFKILKSIEKKNDKKKNLYRECMNLFVNRSYEQFKDFYKQIINIKGYNKNIWELLNKYLDIIHQQNILEPIIVLDDYDDLYMNNDDEIMDKKIISNISKYNKFKFIICGNGKFINNLMLDYLSKNEYEIIKFLIII